MIDRVIPDLLPRPARHGYHDALAVDDDLVTHATSFCEIDLSVKAFGIVEDGKLSDQIR